MAKGAIIRGGNHYQVVSTVWSAKLGADGKPIVGEDGKWVKAAPIARKCTYHNAVTATMLGYEVAYTANSMTTVPVNRIAVLYDSGNSTAYATTTVADGGSGVSAVWTADWQNETSGSQTVTQLNLINYTGFTADTVFATDTDLSIVVPRYATLNVQWTHTWTLGEGDMGTVSATYLGAIRDYFDGTMGTSYPWSTCQFHAEGSNYYNTGVFSITSGGTISDTSVVLTASAENDDENDHAIDELSVVDAAPEGNVVFTDTDISPPVNWGVGEKAYATFTITWAVT